ncbi:hypothetical protein Ndes2526B_g08064 [Nannochloris sp. 'desiccata']|nr:hypothetical protein KSW81_002705 [Chlorella desiccata (nom. nud.)]
MTAFTTTLVVITALFAVACAQEYTGYGTAYSAAYDMDATGQNMCEFNPKSLEDKWQVYYGAMNEADWNKAGGKSGICGKCIRAEGVKGETTPGFKIKPVIVKIVDQCPSWACDQGNVDFSMTALEAITGYDWDKKLITWRYVDCETGKTAEEVEAEKAAAKKAAAEKAAAEKAAAEKAAAEKAAAEKAAAEKAAAEKAAAEKAAAEKAAAEKAAAEKAAAEKAAAARAAAAAAQAAAEARAAAAERAAIAADIKSTTPSIEAEAINALNQVQTVAAAAELVTPEVAAVARVASIPVAAASQVVQEVAQQAELALQATTTDQLVAQQVMATGL